MCLKKRTRAKSLMSARAPAQNVKKLLRFCFTSRFIECCEPVAIVGMDYKTHSLKHTLALSHLHHSNQKEREGERGREGRGDHVLSRHSFKQERTVASAQARTFFISPPLSQIHALSLTLHLYLALSLSLTHTLASSFSLSHTPLPALSLSHTHSGSKSKVKLDLRTCFLAAAAFLEAPFPLIVVVVVVVVVVVDFDHLIEVDLGQNIVRRVSTLKKRGSQNVDLRSSLATPKLWLSWLVL